MTIRIVMLIIGMTSFVAAAAVYMTAELGTAPCDAFVILVANHLPFSFRTVRMALDFSAVVIGWICGNTPGADDISDRTDHWTGGVLVWKTCGSEAL